MILFVYLYLPPDLSLVHHMEQLMTWNRYTYKPHLTTHKLPSFGFSSASSLCLHDYLELIPRHSDTPYLTAILRGPALKVPDFELNIIHTFEIFLAKLLYLDDLRWGRGFF